MRLTQAAFPVSPLCKSRAENTTPEPRCSPGLQSVPRQAGLLVASTGRPRGRDPGPALLLAAHVSAAGLFDPAQRGAAEVVDVCAAAGVCIQPAAGVNGHFAAAAGLDVGVSFSFCLSEGICVLFTSPADVVLFYSRLMVSESRFGGRYSCHLHRAPQSAWMTPATMPASDWFP